MIIQITQLYTVKIIHTLFHQKMVPEHANLRWNEHCKKVFFLVFCLYISRSSDRFDSLHPSLSSAILSVLHTVFLPHCHCQNDLKGAHLAWLSMCQNMCTQPANQKLYLFLWYPWCPYTLWTIVIHFIVTQDVGALIENVICTSDWFGRSCLFWVACPCISWWTP